MAKRRAEQHDVARMVWLGGDLLGYTRQTIDGYIAYNARGKRMPGRFYTRMDAIGHLRNLREGKRWP
jgi:hypothetical protein